MVKIISIFNNKGGVGKSTTAFHLGWMMAEQGKKIVFVDLDPQCNLTGLCLRYGRSADELEDDDIFDSYLSGEIDNIHRSLSPVMESLGERITTPTLTKFVDDLDLYILPGNVDMARIESQLATSLTLGASMPAMQNIPGSFAEIYKLINKEYEPDYIILDMSPSFGAINQVNMFISDYFITPTMPDVFSLMAIDSLASTLPEWKRWSDRAKVLELFEGENVIYNFKPTVPKMLGFVISRFNIKNGRPARAFQKYIDAIENRVSDKLVPQLKKAEMLLDQDAYRNVLDNSFSLSKIQNFNTLIATSQEVGKPVFQLGRDDLSVTGVIADTQLSKIDEFKAEFKSFSNKVIKLTN